MKKAEYIMDAVVERVIDGDTVEATVKYAYHNQTAKVRHRVRNLWCEEITDKDPAKRLKGLEARAFVESLIPPGTKIVVESFIGGNEYFKKTFDRYVSDIFFTDKDGTQKNLAEVVIAAGFGVATRE